MLGFQTLLECTPGPVAGGIFAVEEAELAEPGRVVEDILEFGVAQEAAVHAEDQRRVGVFFEPLETLCEAVGVPAVE